MQILTRAEFADMPVGTVFSIRGEVPPVIYVKGGEAKKAGLVNADWLSSLAIHPFSARWVSYTDEEFAVYSDEDILTLISALEECLSDE